MCVRQDKKKKVELLRFSVRTSVYYYCWESRPQTSCHPDEKKKNLGTSHRICNRSTTVYLSVCVCVYRRSKSTTAIVVLSLRVCETLIGPWWNQETGRPLPLSAASPLFYRLRTLPSRPDWVGCVGTNNRKPQNSRANTASRKKKRKTFVSCLPTD